MMWSASLCFLMQGDKEALFLSEAGHPLYLLPLCPVFAIVVKNHYKAKMWAAWVPLKVISSATLYYYKQAALRKFKSVSWK